MTPHELCRGKHGELTAGATQCDVPSGDGSRLFVTPPFQRKEYSRPADHRMVIESKLTSIKLIQEPLRSNRGLSSQRETHSPLFEQYKHITPHRANEKDSTSSLKTSNEYYGRARSKRIPQSKFSSCS